MPEPLAQTSPSRRTAWPIKVREFQNHSMDSTRWNYFSFREDDIIVASWAKTGTTCVQQILGQLLFDGAEGLPVIDMSPWVEQRYRPLEIVLELLKAQQHRRFVKTHLPVDALVFSPLAKYLYIGRDGRDILFSWHHHHSRMTEHAYNLMNNTPGRVGPPMARASADIRQYFHDWLDGDGSPAWPFWSNVRTWWDARDLPNVLFVHYNDLTRDLAGQIRRIARFLEIDIKPDTWPRVLQHCRFDYMKANGSVLSAMLARGFEGGADDFIYRGTNGRWRDVLTADDVRKYESHVARNLTPACARWLATGELDR